MKPLADPAPLGDSSLAALAFVEAVTSANTINSNHLLDTVSQDDLTVGLANLAACLAQALAVVNNVPLDEVFEVHRALFLHYGNPRSQP